MRTGEAMRYLGALGTAAVMAKFGLDNSEVLASLPWQKMMPYIEGGLSIYGAGETKNAFDDLKSIRASGQRPHILEYIGKGLKSAPTMAYPVGAATGNNPLYSSVLPGTMCIVGYVLDDYGRSIRERRNAE